MWWFLFYWIVGYITLISFVWLVNKQDVYLRDLLIIGPLLSVGWPIILLMLVIMTITESIDWDKVILKGKRTDIEKQ